MNTIKTITIWTLPEYSFRGKPLQLLVAYEIVEFDKIKVSIRGGRNPLPFKETIVSNGQSPMIAKWLKDEGWVQISHFYL